ncbi:MAG: hypothetical protein EOL97_14530 [Spirochaetia bacterium]|nr:hypothetical protein [Spirochaetia bacterium]
MNNLEIVKHNIDWLKIIEMTLKRKDWGKTYNLYIYGDVVVSATMESFNFPLNQATFKIEVKYPEDNYHNSWDNYTMLYIYLSNYSIDDIERLIKNRIKKLLDELIKMRLRKKAKQLYSEFEFESDDIDEEMMEKYNLLEDYYEINNISNDNFRSSALSDFEDTILNLANENYKEKVNSYVEREKDNIEGLYKIKEMVGKEE